MKIRFTRLFDVYERGEQIDVHPLIADWLVQHGFAAYQERINGVKIEDLFMVPQRKEQTMTHAFAGYHLLQSLKKAGLQFPPECYAIELGAGVDGAVAITYRCWLTPQSAMAIGAGLISQMERETPDVSSADSRGGKDRIPGRMKCKPGC